MSKSVVHFDVSAAVGPMSLSGVHGMKLLRFSVVSVIGLFIACATGFAQAPANPVVQPVPPAQAANPLNPPGPVVTAPAPASATAPVAKPAVRAPVLPPGAVAWDAAGRPIFPNTAIGIKARKRYTYQVARAREAQEAAAWDAYVEKMGPIVAAQQRQQFLDNQKMMQLQMEASRTQSMQRMATAEEKQAEINRQRLQLEMYEAYRNRNNP